MFFKKKIGLFKCNSNSDLSNTSSYQDELINNFKYKQSVNQIPLQIEKWDITDTRYPGIYEIYDIKNKMSYYGETECLCHRYASHLRELKETTEANIPRSTLRRYLKKNIDPNIHYLSNEEENYGFIPIFGKKEDGPSVLFESFIECVAAGFATNTQNARRKIQKNIPGWRYAHVDSNGKPRRTPYLLKEGELSYKQYKQLNE